MKVIKDVIRLTVGLMIIDFSGRPLMWVSIIAVFIWGFTHNYGFICCIAILLLCDRVTEGYRKHQELLKFEELEERILKLEEK